ncbi:MAG TPA: hypothetical protein VG713_09845, partial [Pirellulales bacterium]|nr:hypothetical protein [Pirellulales bacterium]
MHLRSLAWTRAPAPWSMTVSATVHGAVAAAACLWPGFMTPRSYTTAAGPSSLALVASMFVDGDEQELDRRTISATVELHDLAGEQNLAPANDTDRRAPVAAGHSSEAIAELVPRIELAALRTAKLAP